jgi:hypothetical protein
MMRTGMTAVRCCTIVILLVALEYTTAASNAHRQLLCSTKEDNGIVAHLAGSD